MSRATDDALPPKQVPNSIGPYKVLDVLGEGGFGVVFRALDPNTGGQVALKRTRSPINDEKTSSAFRSEVALYEKLGTLPNVVGIRTAGEDHGYAYFTMPVMEGGSLRARLGDYRDPRDAARLLVIIARTVDAFHRSSPPVLHRDLKPENVLFDRHGRPHVSDFGIAKIGTEAGWTREHFGIGCPNYSAPEQVLPEYGDLTPATDVYSLGAMFYELLTGTVPHRGKTPDEVLRRIVSEEPLPPRRLRSGLHRDWETICLHALKRANARYPTARDFADDLENALAHRPLIARPSSVFDRLKRLGQRHPNAVSLFAFVCVLGALLFGMHVKNRRAERRQIYAAEVSRARQIQLQKATEERRRRHATSLIQFTASAQAGALLFQLGKYAARVHEAATDPRIVDLVRQRDVSPAHPALRRHLGDFDSLLVLDATGQPRAHSRDVNKPYFKRNFAFREYFQTARAMAQICPHGVHLAPAFRSEEDHKIKFPLSAPLLDAEGKWVGVLMAGTLAAPAFGEVQLQDPDGEQLTALFGPRGKERNAKETRDDFTFLVHPKLPSAVEYQLDEQARSALRQHFSFTADPCRQIELLSNGAFTSNRYHDPLPGFEGDWLAAVAPVGKTGYFVVVQSRPEPETRSKPLEQ